MAKLIQPEIKDFFNKLCCNSTPVPPTSTYNANKTMGIDLTRGVKTPFNNF
jgi:hypothetical protein